MSVLYQILLECVLPNHNRELPRDLTELAPQLALVNDPDDNIQLPHGHIIIKIIGIFIHTRVRILSLQVMFFFIT